MDTWDEFQLLILCILEFIFSVIGTDPIQGGQGFYKEINGGIGEGDDLRSPEPPNLNHSSQFPSFFKKCNLYESIV